MKPNDVRPLRGLALAPYAPAALGGLFDCLDTVVIIALLKPVDAPLDSVTPRLDVAAEACVARPELISAAPRRPLGAVVARPDWHSAEMSRAINRLITGF